MNTHQKNKIPGPKGLSLLRSNLKFKKDPLGVITEMTHEFGDIICFRFGPETLYIISHPDHMKHLFVDHHKNYGKQTRLWKKLNPFLGQGLLSREGEFWQKERKIIQPTFHRERISTFAESMTQSTEELLQKWESYIDTKETIDLLPEMMRLTLEILGKTLINVNLSNEADLIRNSITIIISHINQQARSLLSLPNWIPTSANRRFFKALKTFDELIYNMIKQRRLSKSDHGDMLSMLMNVQDAETGEKMSDQQLRDELITFIFAGHDTTANAMSWICYLLAKHSDIKEKLSQDLKEVLKGDTPRLEDLPKLSLTDRVIKESMRLYPPAWFTGRTALQEDKIGDYLIPMNATLMPCFYLTHHREDFWKDAEKFDPDRFLPEIFSHQHRYAYIPFGTGPRQCIGNTFAMMEMQLVISMIAQRYQFNLQTDFPVEMEPSITLRPRHGVKVTLEAYS